MGAELQFALAEFSVTMAWRKLQVLASSQDGMQVERVSLGSKADIRDVVTPLWRVSYERQLEMKKGQLEAGLRKLLRLLKKKAPKRSKRFDVCYESYKAQVCACFRVGKMVVRLKSSTNNTMAGALESSTPPKCHNMEPQFGVFCMCACNRYARSTRTWARTGFYHPQL